LDKFAGQGGASFYELATMSWASTLWFATDCYTRCAMLPPTTSAERDASAPLAGAAVENTVAGGRSWKRLDGVDALRGLAILFVVLNHVHMRLWLAKIPYANGALKHAVTALVWNGQFGVQMFFAVSGFLITSTTLRRWGTLSRVSVLDFYRLRFARIAPMLFALLAMLCALHWAGVGPYVISAKTGGLWRAVLAALTLHVNVLQARVGWLPANWGVLWSLSVEEMFYLFFPLVARFLGRGKMFVAILFCFVAVGPFARTVWAHGNDVWEEQSYLGGMDAIAMGCLTALVVERVRFSRGALRGMAAIGAALILFILVGLRVTFVPVIATTGLDMTVIAVGSCLVMIAAAETQWRGPRIFAPLFRLGRRSYEVYLTHMFVVFAFFAVFGRCGSAIWAVPILFLATVIATAVVGDLVARYFSEPLNRRLREYWSEGPRQLGSVSET
jgi:peptidoglycan/LPS O-acetylase OafA/YrhL